MAEFRTGREVLRGSVGSHPSGVRVNVGGGSPNEKTRLVISQACAEALPAEAQALLANFLVLAIDGEEQEFEGKGRGTLTSAALAWTVAEDCPNSTELFERDGKEPITIRSYEPTAGQLSIAEFSGVALVKRILPKLAL